MYSRYMRKLTLREKVTELFHAAKAPFKKAKETATIYFGLSIMGIAYFLFAAFFFGCLFFIPAFLH